MTIAHDAFISYSSKDKAIADAVCARLEGHAIRCWIAPRDVQPGQPYGEEIIDAIHTSRVMVLVLSASANASPHIPKEVERAVSQGIPIIPLRIENVMPAKSLDYFISSVHWLDAITPPLDQHLENLANSIRALLPTIPEAPRPQPVIQNPPQTVQTPAPAVSAPVRTIPVSRGKPKWLFPAIALAVVALAAGGWYFATRPAEVVENVQPGSIIVPAQPSRPNLRVPSAIAQPAAEPAGDPLVGCWQWSNNVMVAINSNGSMVAGPFTARWQGDAGHRVYHFTWPEAVDSVTLSPDGNHMSGGNQYGFAMTAARMTPGMEIAGTWRWYNGAIVSILPNGTFSVGTFFGRWQRTAQGYALTWPPPVDTVTISSDRRHLKGGNQYGFPLTATRAGACGG